MNTLLKWNEMKSYVRTLRAEMIVNPEKKRTSSPNSEQKLFLTFRYDLHA